MEYAEIDALFTYWRKNPPTHMLAQGFFKMGGGDDAPSSQDEVPTNEMSEKQFLELTTMFPQ